MTTCMKSYWGSGDHVTLAKPERHDNRRPQWLPPRFRGVELQPTVDATGRLTLESTGRPPVRRGEWLAYCQGRHRIFLRSNLVQDAEVREEVRLDIDERHGTIRTSLRAASIGGTPVRREPEPAVESQPAILQYVERLLAVQGVHRVTVAPDGTVTLEKGGAS